MATRSTAKKRVPAARATKRAIETSPSNASTDVFGALRAILRPFAKRLAVKTDDGALYYLDAKKPWQGKTLFFGAVRAGKARVSFHLFPLYACPTLKDDVSPALGKRMQGKSCFNFTRVDEALFAELATLTARGFAIFEARGMV